MSNWISGCHKKKEDKTDKKTIPINKKYWLNYRISRSSNTPAVTRRRQSSYDRRSRQMELTKVITFSICAENWWDCLATGRRECYSTTVCFLIILCETGHVNEQWVCMPLHSRKKRRECMRTFCEADIKIFASEFTRHKVSGWSRGIRWNIPPPSCMG